MSVQRKARPTPAPPLEPTWLRPWLDGADPDELAELRELAPRCSAELRDAFQRFPPGCVVRCACGSPTCPRAPLIVSGAAARDDGPVILLVQRDPGDVLREIPLARARYEIVHYRAGVTPSVVRALLSATAGCA